MKRYFDLPTGRMAYLDTGGPAARTVVFVHGNPSSSAEFVPVIEALGENCRCIAPDHIGFGDSDKPTDWDYLPSSHAANLALLLDSLDLREATVVVGDWGGPIGLSWAMDHPDRVSRVVITNTWMWPVNRSWYFQGFSKAMGGPVGRFLIRRHNVFSVWVVKGAWGDRTPLTPELHDQFTQTHPVQAERKGMWVFPGQIVGATSWLRDLWERRAVLHDFDVSFVWGMKDIAFRPAELRTWTDEFPLSPVERLADVGHYVALEAPDTLAAAIRR
jgi:haloalkane dehalogenase